MSDSNQEAQLELKKLQKSFGSKSPTLYNMPINIVNQVLEKLEPMDRLRIRKVCRNLRTCVDRFGIHFDYIHFHLWENDFRLEIDGVKISYTDALYGGSTVLEYADRKKILKGTSSMEIALQDLTAVWKHTSQLSIISDGSINDNVATFIDVLKSMKSIHANIITFCKFSFKDVVTILQYFDTKVLENIDLVNTNINDQFESITRLDQWKCAKNLSINNCVLESRQIVHLFHFQAFNIELDDFPTHIAIQIRDDLMRRSTFQGCHIECGKPSSNLIEIAKVFKPDNASGNEFRIEYSTDNATFEIYFCSLSDSYSLGFRGTIVKKSV